MRFEVTWIVAWTIRDRTKIQASATVRMLEPCVA